MEQLRQQLVRYAFDADGMIELQHKHNIPEVRKTLLQYDQEERYFVPTPESILFDLAVDYWNIYHNPMPPQALSTAKLKDEHEAAVKQAATIVFQLPVVLSDMPRVIGDLKKHWVAVKQYDIYQKTLPQGLDNPISNIEAAIAKLTELRTSMRTNDSQQVVTVREMAAKAVDSLIDRRDNPSHYRGLDTGFPSFDDKEGGIFPGELLIVGGRPGIGKSSIMLRMLAQIWIVGNDVLLVNREMSIELQHRRFSTIFLCADDIAAMSLWGGNIQNLIKTGRVSDDQLKAYKAFQDSVAEIDSEFFMTDPMGVRSLAELDVLIERLADERDLQAIAIDSGNIQTLGDREDAWTRDDQQRLIAEKMVELGIKHDAVIMCDLQTNRESGMNEGAGLESFALSDWWGRAAHHAWRIWPTGPNLAELQIIKCRDGESGWTIPLLYDLGRMLIVESVAQGDVL